MKFLKLSRALLFSILLTPIVIFYIFESIDWTISVISIELEFILVFIWLIALNQELMKRIPKHIDISDKLFYVNLFLLFISLSVFCIFAEPGKSYEVTGLAALPFFYF